MLNYEGKPQIIVELPLDKKDFPVLIETSNKFGLIFIFTNMGYFYLYEVTTCQFILKEMLSTPMLSLQNHKTDGIIFINKEGKVNTLDILEAKLIPLIGLKLAERNNLKITD